MAPTSATVSDMFNYEKFRDFYLEKILRLWMRIDTMSISDGLLNRELYLSWKSKKGLLECI